MGPIVGIDLGTTSSLIAWMNPETGFPECIPGLGGSVSCPSVVSIDSDGKTIVGEPARRRLATHPERTIASVKRLIGRPAEEISGRARLPLPLERSGGAARLRLGEHAYTAAEISSFILHELKSWAELHLGQPLGRAAISVPANFNHTQRQATQDAARLAGFESVWLPSEPGVAALACGMLQKRRGITAVCNSGGGMFDVSIVRLTAAANGSPVCEVLSTHGDTRLGGDDADDALLELARGEIRGRFGVELRREGIEELRNALVRAKHELSVAERTQVHYPLDKAGLYVRAITRAEFEALIAPLILRVKDCAEEALAGAGLTSRDVDELILIGNCARMPLVRRAIAESFEREPRATVDPAQIVALGAALWAASLDDRNSGVALREVTPFTISVLSPGGAKEEVISRNSPMPVTARRVFQTARGKSGTEIRVMERTGPESSRSQLLGRVRLRNGKKGRTPGAEAAPTEMEAKISVDANGIVHVLTAAKNSSEWNTVEMRPPWNAPGVAERAVGNDREDTREQLLMEARNEAQALLHAMTLRFAGLQGSADGDQKKAITEAAARLSIAMVGSDERLIRQKIADLRQIAGRTDQPSKPKTDAKGHAAG